MATPVTEMAPATDLEFESTTVVVAPLRTRRPTGRKKSGSGAWLIVSGILLGSVVLGGTIWLLQSADPNLGVEHPSLQNTESANFRLFLPGSGWKGNEKDRLGLVVAYALSRESDHVAIHYKDYRNRLPTVAEFQDLAVTKLTTFFKVRPQYEARPTSNRKLGGEPISLFLDFEGVDAEGVPMVGQCVCVAYRGMGYWLFTWCPEEHKELVGEEWDKVRAGFNLLDNRSGWKETPLEKDVLALKDIPYEIRFTKSIWVPRSLDGYDPKAIAVLLGNDPTETKHAGKAATLQVLLLERKGNPKASAQEAQDYLKQRQIEEGYPETVISPVKEKGSKESGLLEAIGTESGAVSKLHVRNTDTRERFVVLATIPLKDKNLVLLGDCDYARMSFWDVEFKTLLNGLRKQK